MTKKNKATVVQDLFSMLEPDPRWEPAPEQLSVSSPEPQKPPSIREINIDGILYQILVSRPAANAREDDGADTLPIWRISVRDANKWRRLFLTGPDAQHIPDELLAHAEMMLEWAAGGLERTRSISQQLRPPVIEEQVSAF